MSSPNPNRGQSKFRPKARLVSILGEHLIRDATVGIIELVKNGYDADAALVAVELHKLANPAETRVIVRDNGIGMTLDQVLREWLEPASGHKELQKDRGQTTGRGRLPLGEKGVGRFAAHKLGRELILTTRAKGSKTEITVRVDWGDFDDMSSYLDEIPVGWEEHEPREFQGNAASGTILDMRGAREVWTKEDVDRLHQALLRLMSPFKGPKDFAVRLMCPEYEAFENLEPSSILDKAHFVFTGLCDENGLLEYSYESKVPGQKRRTVKDGKEDLVRSLKWNPANRKPQCGPFIIELYYWDLSRPLISASGLTTKQIKAVNGVSIFRDGIRVLPYGGKGDDWLGLNARRIDRPTERISTDGVVAMVEINQGENPDLVDKTNREGLIENQAFQDLHALVTQAITTVFEEEWLKDKPSRQKPAPAKIDEAVEKMAREARKVAAHGEAIQRIAGRVERMVAKGERLPAPLKALLKVARPLVLAAGGLESSSGEVKTAQKQIAEEFEGERDVLLGMAGLGLAAERFTHEFARLTREASDSLRQVRTLIGGSVAATRHVEALEAALDALRGDIHALGPLFYIRKPSKARSMDVRKAVENVLLLNRLQIKDSNVIVEVREHSSLSVTMREGQCTQVINNLVDNAVFWLSRKTQENDRKLRIVIDGGDRTILVADNGHGVMPKYQGRLFEPFFSTKPDARADGRGLGLYISRETLKHVGATIVLTSNDLDAAAFEQGAAFKIQFPEKGPVSGGER